MSGSSRITLDTTSLTVRSVIAKNPDTGLAIQEGYIPVIAKQGLVTWKNSYEFLSTVSIPQLNTSFLGAVQMIQPGLSSLSTVFYSTMESRMTSTVEGLGSVGYVSTSKLFDSINNLGSRGYISTQTLYNCINRLGDLQRISPSFANVGYVSTLHPGEYKIYQSSLGLQGHNLGQTVTSLAPNFTKSAVIDIGGFSRHIVGSSKMKIEVNANVWITHTAAAETTMSTFLTAPGQTSVIGTPVVLTYNKSSASLGNATFLLNSNDIQGRPNLQLCHSLTRGGTMETTIPLTGGIHVTLDNTD
jgi:hypothetical protein